MKKSRAILGAVLGLALTVPLSPLTAEAAGGRWDQVDVKTRRYFVPDGQIEKQTTVLSSSEKLVSTANQTQRGRHLQSGADAIGGVTTKEVAAPAKDKVTVVPGAAEAIGNDWVEYEIVKREKAFERTYSQQENKFDLYVEQTRSAQTFQVTDKVRTVETWTDPVTKQTQQTVADSTQTRNDVRYSAWTDSNKQIRVDAGTSTRTWGPDLVFTKVADEQRIAKRSPLTPPGGMQAGWWLYDTETFRYFVAGNTPPSDAKQATDAKGNEIREGTGPGLGGANSDWVLVNSQTIRDFIKGSTPPKGSVAANPDQRDALLDPLSAGWILANSELLRYFVPGDAPPKDAELANPGQKASIDAGVTNDWVLTNVENLRNFIAGNVPPQDATRSKDPANYDPSGNGDWALENIQRYRFFVAIPGDFENPIPNRPVDPARQLIKEEIVQHHDKATTLEEPNNITSWREGLLIKRTYPKYKLTPQTLVKTYQHWAQQLETYLTYENRDLAVNLGSGSEMMAFQVPVKNYKWVPTKTQQTQEYTALEDFKQKIADLPLPTLRASEITSLAVANGERPSSFQGDSGAGGKAALTAAKQRQQMGANQVKVSDIVLTPEQIEEARKAAEEQARQQQEAENRKRAEEEAQRKKEREEEALRQQQIAQEAAAKALAKTDWIGWFQKGNDAVRFDTAKISIYKREKSVWKLAYALEDTGSYSKDFKTYNDPTGPNLMTNGNIELIKEKNGDLGLKGEFTGTWGTNKKQSLKVDGFKKKGAPDLSAPKVSTYKVDAKANVADESKLDKAEAVTKSVAGPNLEQGKLYEITATGTAKYTLLLHSVHWFGPDDASGKRFKILVLNGTSVKKVIPYAPGQGITLIGDDLKGHTLKFIFEDENAGDNVAGSGFNVTVTASPMDPED
ncbi:hypothetical protein D3C87_551640 [compost metagenome]